MQHKAFIHLTIIGVNYSYYYIEDGTGFNFPKIDSPHTNESVLHNIKIQYAKGNCKDYSKDNVPFKTTKDDFIQECVAKKYRDNYGELPMFVNLNIYPESKDLPEKKNDTDLAEKKKDKYLAEKKKELGPRKFRNEPKLNETFFRRLSKRNLARRM